MVGYPLDKGEANCKLASEMKLDAFAITLSPTDKTFNVDAENINGGFPVFKWQGGRARRSRRTPRTSRPIKRPDRHPDDCDLRREARTGFDRRERLDHHLEEQQAGDHRRRRHRHPPDEQ